MDGDIIPTNPVLEDGFAESGKDIPLLIGSNLNEWNFTMEEPATEEAAVLESISQNYGDKAEAILEAFKVAYPEVAPFNAALVDSMLRAPLFKITAHKADQGGAPVYSYIMTYGAPMAVHGAEIPLIFENTTPENEEMAGVMSSIWASFARTGVPEAEGLPAWEPYTREGGACMILDLHSSLVYHHDEELLSLLKPGYVF